MSEKKYPVLEIFNSPQGEGRYTGVMCTFVRFAGCNLACPWCDTKEKMEGTSVLMSAEEIADKLSEYFVVFTGGEPLLQDLESIIERAGHDNHFYMIETNGTQSISESLGEMLDYIACSPKPDSHYMIHPSIVDMEYRGKVDYKYVVDGTLGASDIRCGVMGSITYLQPEAYSQKESVKKALALMESIGDLRVRLGIQAHRFWEVE